MMYQSLNYFCQRLYYSFYDLHSVAKRCDEWQKVVKVRHLPNISQLILWIYSREFIGFMQ